MSRQERLFDTAAAAGPLLTTGAAAVRAALARYRLPVSNEAAMQAAVEKALFAEGFIPQREVTRGADRIDFLVGTVVVELKVKGSVGDVVRQLNRYAAWDEIAELVLVTSCASHATVPESLGGKPVSVLVVRGMF